MNMLIRRSLAATTAVIATAALAACGGEDSAETPGAAPAPASDTPAMASPTPASMAASLVGPGCADYAAKVPEGAGSVQGMADAPLATAASNNPLLTTLTAAVSGGLNKKVDLVDTLNGGEFTVFAPVDEAFAKVPAKTVNTLKTDDELLTTILTYHVVQGQLSPDSVVGTQKTVQGTEVKITGSGDELKVNDAKVICGGVKTANATVYLIDAVLTPAAK